MDSIMLKEILEKHSHYLKEDCEGWEDMKCDLRCANLHYAKLYGADLREADLRGADLRGADLRGANLRYAKLHYANLCSAVLYGADLRGADLRETNLRCTNLIDVDLCNADLRWSDLCEADLFGTNLQDAKLYSANLDRAENVPYIPYSCPDFGSFIGYKKAKNGIIELEILADSKRSSATGRKCRCEKAKVLGIYDSNHNLLDIKETVSNFDGNFIYKVGEIVEEPDFDENRWNECAEGIHFFVNFHEAVNY